MLNLVVRCAHPLALARDCLTASPTAQHPYNTEIRPAGGVTPPKRRPRGRLLPSSHQKAENLLTQSVGVAVAREVAADVTIAQEHVERVAGIICQALCPEPLVPTDCVL